MRDQAVGHLTRDRDHARAEAAHVHRRTAERVRTGIERRDHQRVSVEVALELQGPSGLPCGEDRLDRTHQLVHASGRLRPRGAVPVHDVRAHLRTEPEHETASSDELQVVGEIRQVHRRARERDRDGGAEPHARRVLGGHRERDERVVLGFEREHAVVADLLEPRVRRAHVARVLERAGGEDLHAAGQASVSIAIRRRPASMSARCVNACGKLPRCWPVVASISSAYRCSGPANERSFW